MVTRKLSSFVEGQRGRVTLITAEDRIKRRLFDMGLTPGTEVLFKKFAPLGDPLEIRLRGYDLSLRGAEADNIIMEVTA